MLSAELLSFVWVCLVLVKLTSPVLLMLLAAIRVVSLGEGVGPVVGVLVVGLSVEVNVWDAESVVVAFVLVSDVNTVVSVEETLEVMAEVVEAMLMTEAVVRLVREVVYVVVGVLPDIALGLVVVNSLFGSVEFVRT